MLREIADEVDEDMDREAAVDGGPFGSIGVRL